MKHQERKASYIQEWVAHADDNFAAAKAIIQHAPDSTSSAAHLAHQAMEKYLKALYARFDTSLGPVPKTHNLKSLQNAIRGALGRHSFLAISMPDMDVMEPYGPDSRYPGAQPTSPEDAEAAVRIVETVAPLVKQELEEFLSVDVPERKGRSR